MSRKYTAGNAYLIPELRNAKRLSVGDHGELRRVQGIQPLQSGCECVVPDSIVPFWDENVVFAIHQPC